MRPAVIATLTQNGWNDCVCTPLITRGEISLWSDTQIRAGSTWMEEIDQAIYAAKVAVLLVSPDYLASDFIVEQELPRLLAKAQKEGLRIVWIPISDCLWSETPLANFQAALNPHTPLATLTNAQRDEAFVQISKRIIQALKR